MMLDIVSITIVLALNLKVKADINLYLEANIQSIRETKQIIYQILTNIKYDYYDEYT